MKNNLILIGLMSIWMIGLTSKTAAQDKITSDTSKKRIFFYPAEVIPASEKGTSSWLSVAPNPAKNQVNIKLNVAEPLGYVLELYDDKGMRLLQQNWRGEALDISRYRSGIYILLLRKDKESHSQKLIIER